RTSPDRPAEPLRPARRAIRLVPHDDGLGRDLDQLRGNLAREDIVETGVPLRFVGPEILAKDGAGRRDVEGHDLGPAADPDVLAPPGGDVPVDDPKRTP